MDIIHTVHDPEIPVLTVIDLGVVKKVTVEGKRVSINLTPTYSGCPATRIINLDIETALNDHGIKKVTLKRQLSPAWTTDWLSEKGKAKLENYGIAPPQTAGGPAQCPRCKSAQVEKISQFGSTPCKAQWRCTDCLEPFDYFKCI